MPCAFAGRPARGSLQEPEHGAQQRCHGRWARDGARPDHAGRGVRHRARRAHEPHPAQARKRPPKPAHRGRQGAGSLRCEGLLRAKEGAHAADFGVVRFARGGKRRHRHRGRRQPRRNQPCRKRHRQHGARARRVLPRAARGRHRPRRGVCPALRHGRAPCARGPCAFAGACGEQVPRRCGNPAPGFGPARENVRGSRRGGRAVSYARPGRRGLARAAPICPRGARRHRRRRRAPSASVELHRLRPAFARARRGRALRFLDDRSGPTRPGGAPRLEDHARRRALACG